MTTQEIIDYGNFIASKNQSGNTLRPKDANIAMQAVNLELFNEWINLYVKGEGLPPDARKKLIDAGPLKNFVTPFEVLLAGAPCDNPAETLPDDFGYPIGGTVLIVSEGKQILRPLQIYSEAQMRTFQTGSLGPDLSIYPGATIRNRVLEFKGRGLWSFMFLYFRIPKTPFYDYCIPVNQGYTYLPAGYYLISRIDGLYDVWESKEAHDGGVAALYTGVTYPVTAPVSGMVKYSRTTELEWETMYHLEFANRMLEKMALNVRDGAIANYAAKEQAQGQ